MAATRRPGTGRRHVREPGDRHSDPRCELHARRTSTSPFSPKTACWAWGLFPLKGTRVDADLINAGKQTVTDVMPGSAFFDSARQLRDDPRRQHQPEHPRCECRSPKTGDLANWMIPGKMVKGMGGAMDLVAGVEQRRRADGARGEEEGRHDRPEDPAALHAAAHRRGRVDRIITDLAVLDVTPHGLKVVEMAPGVTRDELQSKTGVPLQ